MTSSVSNENSVGVATSSVLNSDSMRNVHDSESNQIKVIDISSDTDYASDDDDEVPVKQIFVNHGEEIRDARKFQRVRQGQCQQLRKTPAACWPRRATFPVPGEKPFQTFEKPPADEHFTRRIRRTIQWYQKSLGGSCSRSDSEIDCYRLSGYCGVDPDASQLYSYVPSKVNPDQYNLMVRKAVPRKVPLNSMQFGVDLGGLNMPQFLHCRQIGLF